MKLFNVNIPLEERLRPMVNDLLKVATTMIVIKLLQTNATTGTLNFSVLLEPLFVQQLLFSLIAFSTFYLVVLESVDIKLQPSKNFL